MNMDNELRDALRRKEAPVDLADRVLALARQRSERATAARITADATRPGHATSGRSGSGMLRWLAAAAVVTLSVGAAERYYTHQQQAAEAARVQEDIRIALQITSEKLALVQSKISDAGSERGR